MSNFKNNDIYPTILLFTIFPSKAFYPTSLDLNNQLFPLFSLGLSILVSNFGDRTGICN
jgi:hypothetical protein